MAATAPSSTRMTATTVSEITRSVLSLPLPLSLLAPPAPNAVGAVVGALVGAPVAVGAVVGALVGAPVGAAVGAAVGESVRRTHRQMALLSSSISAEQPTNHGFASFSTLHESPTLALTCS
mmetsp:Transcript_5240/g.15946  ORF Transcript_5240/g.15946 Transcript_5240/m.15946 type:complete len:121 (-) Transcript_5240:666-1028(-)